jgi:release factor glutamine methyltransferase
MSDFMSLKSCFVHTKQRLKAAGIAEYDPDSWLLCAFSLKISRLDLITNPEKIVSQTAYNFLEENIKKRLLGIPIYRIIGQKEFYKIDLKLSPETLEPRSDTEIIIDQLIDFIGDLNKPLHILDLGTGTGAIALALLSQFKNAIALGVDISSEALETASQNAILNGLDARFKTLKSNMFDEVTSRFDVIVSNPPYIAHHIITTLAPEVKNHDPLTALDGGFDGLEFYRVLASHSHHYLKENGVVCVEIGYDQAIAVHRIFENKGYTLIELRKDLGGHDRAMVFKLK